ICIMQVDARKRRKKVRSLVGENSERLYRVKGRNIFLCDDAFRSRKLRFSITEWRLGDDHRDCSYESLGYAHTVRDDSLQQSQHRTAEGVVPGVRHHSRAKAPAPPSQQSEHQTENADQQHAPAAL